MATVAISGNTYPVKDQLKAMGARWNAEAKAWMVPAEKAEAARSLVTGAPAKSSPSGRPRYHSCHACGRPSRGYYYCWDCKQDHDDSPIEHKFTRADGTRGVWVEY